MTTNSFAKALGYSRSMTLYHVLNEKDGEGRKISAKLATKICSVFPEIDKAWLLTGQGEMITNSNIPINQTLTEMENYQLHEFFDALNAKMNRLNGLSPYLKKRITWGSDPTPAKGQDSKSCPP